MKSDEPASQRFDVHSQSEASAGEAAPLILIVESDARVAGSVGRLLRSNGYRTEVAPDAESALSAIARVHAALIILDLDLPGMTGDECLRELRARGCESAVIVFTSVSDVARKVAALREGADDYITRPSDMAELTARVGAALRRGRASSPHVVRVDFLTLDTESSELRCGDYAERLTDAQARLMTMLMSHWPDSVSADRIKHGVRPRGRRMSHDSCKMLVSATRVRLKRVTDGKANIVWSGGSGWALVLRTTAQP